MAPLTHLFSYQFLAWRRALERGGKGREASLTVATLVSFVLTYLAVRPLLGLTAAARDGSPEVWFGATRRSLLFLFLLWLALPSLTDGIQASKPGLSLSRLFRFPLTSGRLLLASIMGWMLNPSWWIILGGSVIGLVPLAAATHDAAAALAAALFLVTAMLASWTFSLVTGAALTSRRYREFSVVLTLVLSMAFPFLRLGFPHAGAPRGSSAGGILAAVSDLTPAGWAAHVLSGGSPWPWLAFLLLASTLLPVAAYISLRRMLVHPFNAARPRRAGSGRIRPLPFAPPRVGLAAGKELRYLTQTMDAGIGLFLGLTCGIWILSQDAPPMWIVWAGVLAIVISEAAMPLNAFGLDNSGADRYRIAPLSGRDVLRSKNLAFFSLVAGQTLPVAVAATIRIGVAIGFASLTIGLCYAILVAAWGNFVSVRMPAPREFYNMDSNEQVGGLAAVLGCIATGVLVVLASSTTWKHGSAVVIAAHAAGAAACLWGYRLLLHSAGRVFEGRAEDMRQRLSGGA
jgi:hypothetical protein